MKLSSRMLTSSMTHCVFISSSFMSLSLSLARGKFTSCPGSADHPALVLVPQHVKEQLLK